MLNPKAVAANPAGLNLSVSNPRIRGFMNCLNHQTKPQIESIARIKPQQIDINDDLQVLPITPLATE